MCGPFRSFSHSQMHIFSQVGVGIDIQLDLTQHSIESKNLAESLRTRKNIALPIHHRKRSSFQWFRTPFWVGRVFHVDEKIAKWAVLKFSPYGSLNIQSVVTVVWYWKSMKIPWWTTYHTYIIISNVYHVSMTVILKFTNNLILESNQPTPGVKQPVELRKVRLQHWKMPETRQRLGKGCESSRFFIWKIRDPNLEKHYMVTIIICSVA